VVVIRCVPSRVQKMGWSQLRVPLARGKRGKYSKAVLIFPQRGPK
jgi:hypothetical protein